ncbi:hypothetical protein D3C87_1626080 [compost metagenome]
MRGSAFAFAAIAETRSSIFNGFLMGEARRSKKDSAKVITDPKNQVKTSSGCARIMYLRKNLIYAGKLMM